LRSDGGVHVDCALIPESIMARVDWRRDAGRPKAQVDQHYAADLRLRCRSRGARGRPVQVEMRAVDHKGRAASKSEMLGLTCGNGRHWPR
jgi:hypothetical protein